MLRYLINGVREEVSNRLGKLVRSDAFANAVGDYDQFRVPELDHNSFLSLPPVAPERMARYHAEAEAMIASLEDSGAGGIYKHIVGADHFSTQPGSLFYEALDENLIGQVSAYFGQRPLLHGARLLVTEPTGSAGVERDQMWHRDRYDSTTLRLFIYLDDCDLEQGPFRYLPRQQSDKLWRTLISRVSDDYLRDRGDLEHVVEVVGKAGDRFVADVRRLVHCGSRITRGRRLVFNAIYTTATPWKPPQISRHLLDQLLQQPLSDLQRSVLLR